MIGFRVKIAKKIPITLAGDKIKATSSEMEAKALGSVLELVEMSCGLKLEDVLSHWVTDACLTLFNANGTMRKTQTTKLQQKLQMHYILEPTFYTSIVDMGLLWHISTPAVEDREKSDGSKYTWRDYADKLVQILLSRHKNAECIICVNDSYTQSFSIKDSERLHRQKNLLVPNIVIRTNDKFPSYRDFNSILSKPENKVRL